MFEFETVKFVTGFVIGIVVLFTMFPVGRSREFFVTDNTPRKKVKQTYKVDGKSYETKA